MSRLTSKLKLLLYISIVGLSLLFSPLPVQSVSAQNMNMNKHNLAVVEVGRNGCGPCAISSVASMPEKQKPPIKDEEQDPEPPEQLPLYAQNLQFTEPKQPVSSFICGNLIRPPDLVKLYANFRF